MTKTEVLCTEKFMADFHPSGVLSSGVSGAENVKCNATCEEECLLNRGYRLLRPGTSLPLKCLKRKDGRTVQY